MARNVARNSAQRPGSHGVRVVRCLSGGGRISSIDSKFRALYGRAEATRSEVSGGCISTSLRGGEKSVVWRLPLIEPAREISWDCCTIW